MGNTKVIRSGDVRYDRDNKEVKLVRAFVSENPDKNLWAVMYTDKKMTKYGLAMARSLGDLVVKNYGISAEPEARVRARALPRDSARARFLFQSS